MKKFLIIMVLILMLILGVGLVSASSINGGEGFKTNCPGPVIMMLNEEGGIDIVCSLWIRHCSDVGKAWDNGTDYIQVQCENGKPTLEPPGGPPPQFKP